MRGRGSKGRSWLPWSRAGLVYHIDVYLPVELISDTAEVRSQVQVHRLRAPLPSSSIPLSWTSAIPTPLAGTDTLLYVVSVAFYRVAGSRATVTG